MPADYKKKYLAEWWSLDIPPKKTKKNIESSNRWKAKRECEAGIEEWEEENEEYLQKDNKNQ